MYITAVDTYINCWCKDEKKVWLLKGMQGLKNLILYITELVLRKLYTILSNPIYIRLYSCFSYQILAHWGNLS